MAHNTTTRQQGCTARRACSVRGRLILHGKKRMRAAHYRTRTSWPRPPEACATNLPRFYSSLRGPSCRVANDLRHCVLWRLTPAFVFLLFGTSCPRQKLTEECRPGRCGRAGRFRARGRKNMASFFLDGMLFGFGPTSGLVPAVDNTMLVSSSRRPAPVNRLSLPWAPCFAKKK